MVVWGRWTKDATKGTGRIKQDPKTTVPKPRLVERNILDCVRRKTSVLQGGGCASLMLKARQILIVVDLGGHAAKLFLSSATMPAKRFTRAGHDGQTFNYGAVLK
jgi:uncharacterized protein YcgI (DUF1989 family)